MALDLCFGCMEHTGGSGVCPKCGFDPAAYTVEPHQLRPGTLLKDRYAVGRVLGEGGFGITYVGRDTLLDLKVAVKEFYMSGYVNRNNTYSTVVQASIGTHAEMFEKNREKFLQEARVLAKFANEDGIVGIRDFFQENNTAYIVMDFLSGGTMRDFLHRVGKLTWEQTHHILRPVLISLGNVHAHNIIHRDISPDNIMMTGDGKVKLLDFGAAREISQTDIKSLSVILKPGYAPEEQYRSKGQQGPWTDIYALCATMYRCLTGEVPDDSMERMFNDQLKSPYERGVAPIAISNVLMKGLAVRQTNRYQSIAELRADIALAERDPHNAAIAAPVVRPVVPGAGAATVYSGPGSQTGSRTGSQTGPRTGGQTGPRTGGQTGPGDPNATVFATGGTGQGSNARGPISQAGPTRGSIPPEFDMPAGIPANRTSDWGGQGPGPVSGPADTITGAVAPIKPGDKGGKGKPADPKDGKPVKGNKKGLLIVALVAVIAIALGVLLLGGKKPSGTIPAPFSDYSFTLNEVEYELPMMVDELIGDDWIAEEEAELEETLQPGRTSSILTFTNGYGDIAVRFENPTDSVLPVRECPITYVSMSYYGLVTNYLNKEVNSAEIANGMVLGTTKESSFKSRAPKGYGIEKGGNPVYTYEAGNGCFYNVTFDKDDNTMLSFSISSDVPADFVSNKIATVAPDFDEQAFRENAALQWFVKCEDFSYVSSVYLKDLMSCGWELEESPDYLTSGTTATAYLRANKLATLTQTIYNPFDVAIIPEYCFVEKIIFNKGSLPSDTEFTLTSADGRVSISGDMKQDEIADYLDECGIEYEEDGTELVFYPCGDEARTITLSFSEKGNLFVITMNASEAIRNFFEE